MKKKLFFLPLAAAMMLSACSDDEPGVNGGNDNGTLSDARYLAISIVSTDGNFSRATGDSRYTDDNNLTLTYEDGVESENAVKGLRIYFFGTQGSPIDVRGEGVNYYDVPVGEISTSDPAENHENLTVEKKINAVLVVNAGQRVPAKLVAVVNPTGELGVKSYNLTELRRFVNDYSTFANNANDEERRFVMTNSTYVDGGAMVEAETIMPENFAKSVAEAKANPVTIYVERAVAKVRIDNTIPDKIDIPGNTKGAGFMIPVLDKETKKQVSFEKTEGTTTSTVDVFVKFYGWDITGDLKWGYLLKNVNPSWRTNLLGSVNWNDKDNHRSYWADVCNGGTQTNNNNQYFSYANKSNFKMTKFDGSEWKYCNENAEKKYEENKYYKNTQVIIKGELCDANGNPLTFTEIAGTRIIDDANFTNLKLSYLTMLKSGKGHSHWKVTTLENGTTEIKEIRPEDISFVTANAVNKVKKSDAKAVLPSGTYYVYPCLSTTATASNVKWYTNLTQSTGADGKPVYVPDPNAEVTVKQINDHLYELNHAKIWNSGMTYYFTNIMHNTDGAGVAGVVRNHIYDITLQNVYGFGTPVYDPDEEIIPEKPENEDTYVAAEIKILSWRLVETSTDLVWD